MKTFGKTDMRGVNTSVYTKSWRIARKPPESGSLPDYIEACSDWIRSRERWKVKVNRKARIAIDTR
jgi:hypothetical protein